jgi:hypothetical protein
MTNEELADKLLAMGTSLIDEEIARRLREQKFKVGDARKYVYDSCKFPFATFVSPEGGIRVVAGDIPFKLEYRKTTLQELIDYVHRCGCEVLYLLPASEVVEPSE